MYKAFVCCKAGMGSSMLLKIKADQVIKDNNSPIHTIHGSVDSLFSFNGDLVITMADLKREIDGRFPYVIGVDHVIDKGELKNKLDVFLAQADH